MIFLFSNILFKHYSFLFYKDIEDATAADDAVEVGADEDDVV
jgi:hypothetical protein